MTDDSGVVDAVTALRKWSGDNLAGRIITVASGKGGVGKTTLAVELAYSLDAVLVDLDWDDGCAARALGWRHETRVRSPLLDAVDAGRAPRTISGGPSKPDLVPSGPDLAANQPPPEMLADQLTAWAQQWHRPVVVDTHPGGGAAAYGALSAAHAVAGPVQLGEKELDACAGWCAELAGFPVVLVPNRVPRVPPAAQLDWLERIATEHQLTVSTPVPEASWLPRRKARTALTSTKRLSARSAPLIASMASVAREVGSYAAG